MSGVQVLVEHLAGLVQAVLVDGEVVADGPRLPARAGPALLALATRHPDATISWLDQRARILLTPPERWSTLLDHPFDLRSTACLHHDDATLAGVGAADFDSALASPPPRHRPVGTWLVSPVAGTTRAEVLRAAAPPDAGASFSTWTLLLGRRATAAGALVWSDPALVRPEARDCRVRAHTPQEVADGVRQGFGVQFLPGWVAAAPDRRAAACAALRATARRGAARADEVVPLPWDRLLAEPDDAPPPIDVVIPTRGRRDLLVDTLDDLAAQTVLPHKVVVVEQHDDARSRPLRLDGAPWPFTMEHLVIRRFGAGNARNLAISRCRSPWVLMLDDDVRFEADMVERLWAATRVSGAEAITARLELVRPGEPVPPVDGTHAPLVQMWPGFGSGGALVARHLLGADGGFDRRIDGGFGEDTELGVRLRQQGTMVLMTLEPPIAHLKAPVGGMRAPFPHPWQDARVRPKPSPTVLLARRSFETSSQAVGYRVHWWLEALRRDGLKLHPVQRWRSWNAAQRWTEVLARSEDPRTARAIPPRGPDSTPTARDASATVA